MAYGATAPAHVLLRFICNYQDASGGVSPTFDEMKESIGCRGKGHIARLLHQLEDRGHIQRLPHRARAIVVLQRPPIPVVDMRDRSRFVHLTWDDGEKRLVPLAPDRNPA